MSSPITAADFDNQAVSDTLCDSFRAKLLNNSKIKQFLTWLLTNQGNFTDEVVLALVDCFYGEDTGSANALAITTTPSFSPLKVGQRFFVRAAHANTGTCTLAVNGTTAAPIKKVLTQDLASGDVQVGQIIEVLWDGTFYQMVNTLPTVTVTTAWSKVKSWTETIPAVDSCIGGFAHGFGVAPKKVTLRLLCNDAGGNAGYAQSDILDEGAYYAPAGSTIPLAALYDATNVFIQRGATWTGSIMVWPKVAAGAHPGAFVPIDESKWRLLVDAYV